MTRLPGHPSIHPSKLAIEVSQVSQVKSKSSQVSNKCQLTNECADGFFLWFLLPGSPTCERCWREGVSRCVCWWLVWRLEIVVCVCVCVCVGVCVWVCV